MLGDGDNSVAGDGSTSSARSSGGGDPGVSIVIPAFNEELRLPVTLDRLLVELPEQMRGDWEIIVADDGSTDGTAASMAAHLADSRVRLTANATNRGKGAALIAGASLASHPLVVFLDADLPVPVATISQMVGMAATADLVLGSRRLPGASFDPPQPLPRRVGGAVFRMVVRMMGYRISSDPQCGVKLIRHEGMAPTLSRIRCVGFAFDVELIERARQSGAIIDELPVAWSHVPGSSLRPVRDAVSTLSELARLRRRLDLNEPVVA